MNTKYLKKQFRQRPRDERPMSFRAWIRRTALGTTVAGLTHSSAAAAACAWLGRKGLAL